MDGGVATPSTRLQVQIPRRTLKPARAHAADGAVICLAPSLTRVPPWDAVVIVRRVKTEAVATTFEQALAEFDSAAYRPIEHEADLQREETLRRYPREGWPQMTLEEYAQGQEGDLRAGQGPQLSRADDHAPAADADSS